MSNQTLKLRYQDIFWSSDYINGIDSLTKVLENGQLTGQIAMNYFESQITTLESELTKLSQFINSQERLLASLQSNTKLEIDTILSNLGYPKIESAKSIDFLSHEQLVIAKEKYRSKEELLATLKSAVLLVLSDFLEEYKYFSDDTKKSLLSDYNVYRKSVYSVETAKTKFYTKSTQLSDQLVTKIEQEDKKPVETISLKEHASEEDEDPLFEFPLHIGSTELPDQEALKSFINLAFAQIPIKKPFINIPGTNGEYFTSEDFTQWVRKNFSDNGARSQIEKFGQALVNFGLISPWSRLGSNEFVSDGGSYQFTDLARYVAKFDEENSSEEQPSKTDTKSTPKKVSEAWIGIKSKLAPGFNLENLKEQRSSSRESYLDAVKLTINNRESLELSIISLTKRAQIYEHNRIELLYNLQHKFHELLLENNQNESKQLVTQIQSFKTSNETIEVEQLKTPLKYSIGWYHPKSEATFTDYVDDRAPNLTLFGIDLVAQYTDRTSEDWRTRSTPLFFTGAMIRLENVDYPLSFWTSDIDIQSATDLKEWSLDIIANSSNKSSHLDETIFRFLDELFVQFETRKIINLLKLWLLELPDSLLPFTLYDALVRKYANGRENDESISIIQTIGSIPRQNLSTLLLLISHIKKKFSESLVDLERDSFFVPFVYYFLRPKPNVNYLVIEDAFTLKPLVSDLFKDELQELLFDKLNEMERHQDEKEKREAEALNKLKELRIKDTSSTSSPNRSRASSNVSLNHNGLRDFKTPVSSPASSPAVTSTPNSRNQRSHARTRSLLATSSNVKRPSADLSKRNSQS